MKNVISPQSYWRTPLTEWIWMKLNIQNVKTLNTKELLRVHSRLKHDQLARVASCTFGATCTMNKNVLSSAICAEWLAQVLICKCEIVRIAEGAGGETAEVLCESCNEANKNDCRARKSNFWKACDKRHYSTKFLKNNFEWMNLNEIKHSKRKDIDYQIAPKFICTYSVLLPNHLF